MRKKISDEAVILDGVVLPHTCRVCVWNPNQVGVRAIHIFKGYGNDIYLDLLKMYPNALFHEGSGVIVPLKDFVQSLASPVMRIAV